MKLSIIIPAYNEEQRLKPMLDAYTPYFVGRYGDQIEFIVVVNGSKDRTENVARDYERVCPQVRTLVEPRKIGKGGAIIMGFRAARGELIGFVDADGSTPPEAFEDLVRHIDHADVVIASRWRKESVVSPRQPFSRRIASRAFNTLVLLLFRLPLTDTQCGAKLMRREAVQAVLPMIGVTQWAFDVDLLFQLKREGFKILEVPTTWHDVAGSQLRVGKASIEMFMAITRLRLIYSPFKGVVGVVGGILGRILPLHNNK